MSLCCGFESLCGWVAALGSHFEILSGNFKTPCGCFVSLCCCLWTSASLHICFAQLWSFFISPCSLCVSCSSPVSSLLFWISVVVLHLFKALLSFFEVVWLTLEQKCEQLLHTVVLMLTSQLLITFFGGGLCHSGPLSHRNRWDTRSLWVFSCRPLQALICSHSASHQGFKDEWIISLGGSERISMPPKNDWYPKIVDLRHFSSS